MELSKKRETWTDSETRQMLVIIKKKFATKLLNNKSHRNIKIFEEISKEMTKYGIIKTAIQIRIKYKCLKCDYKKLMEDADNYHGSVRRHTKQHFELLDSIFKRTPIKRSKSTETLSTAVEEQTFADPLCVTTYHVSEVTEGNDNDNVEDETVEQILPETQLPEDNASVIEEIKEEIDEDAASSTATDKQQQDDSTPQIRTFKQQKRQSYQKVVETFTKEWKISQKVLLENMERHDQNYLRSVEEQCKRQEAMLREDRQEIEKILKQDRQEMKNFFISILGAMGLPELEKISLPNTENSSAEV